jgi:hypothetical protein
MTTKAARKKQEKKRAEKKKHAHVTEEMTERHAREKRSRTEGTIAVISLLAIFPFLIMGVLWWPSSSGKAEHGDLTLPDGTYEATYVESQPAGGAESGAAVLLVDGQSVLVTGGDLSGRAGDDIQSFFEGRPGAEIEITVEDGYITSWRQQASP